MRHLRYFIITLGPYNYSLIVLGFWTEINKKYIVLFKIHTVVETFWGANPIDFNVDVGAIKTAGGNDSYIFLLMKHMRTLTLDHFLIILIERVFSLKYHKVREKPLIIE